MQGIPSKVLHTSNTKPMYCIIIKTKSHSLDKSVGSGSPALCGRLLMKEGMKEFWDGKKNLLSRSQRSLAEGDRKRSPEAPFFGISAFNQLLSWQFTQLGNIQSGKLLPVFMLIVSWLQLHSL